MEHLKTVKEGIFRVFQADGNQSMLSKYGIIQEGDACKTVEGSNAACGAYTLIREENCYLFQGGKKTIQIQAEPCGEGFEIQINLAEDERLFGLGDSGRTKIMRRGTVADMTIKDIVGYAPIPLMISSYGWGIFTNCTYEHKYDMGCSQKDKVIITAEKGNLDFYLFIGKSMAEVLGLYTDIAGKPLVLPKFAYGFTFVENEQIDARGLLWDIRALRDRDIPCDLIGLEPNWMSKHYDYSTDKSWNKKDFYLPEWLPENQSGSFTFFYPMREMGMQLSLWLCENYDLFWEEEGERRREEEAEAIDRLIGDKHLENDVVIDEITKQGQPWFEHLKKFVDNGAAAFKLDGATQVLKHPDRLWAGRYLDEEAHNMYPVVLAKQMMKGFYNHTGRRAFIYSAGGYAGIQQYAATWAGDTGGDWKAVMSVFLHAMSGHVNATCDMEVSDPCALHCGFLLPWAQQLGWSNWRYPWFLSPEKEEMFRFYSKLRSSLFPYIYAMAHIAARTAMPIVRPLPLVYEGTDEFDEVYNLYMLVGIFDMNFRLPEGIWIDYWTGEEYSGQISYRIPRGRGGALFVKKGSVLVTMKPQKYLLEKEHDYIIDVYPGGKTSFTLIEDDGFTYDYLEGKLAETEIIMGEPMEDSFEVTVRQRKGFFEGRPNNGHHQEENSIPEIKGMQPVRDMEIVIHTKDVKKVVMNDVEVDFSCNDRGEAVVMLPAGLHEENDVRIMVFV